jgi:hypothetical protein
MDREKWPVSGFQGWPVLSQKFPSQRNVKTLVGTLNQSIFISEGPVLRSFINHLRSNNYMRCVLVTVARCILDKYFRRYSP